jgi:isoleucyl-tRNA synthetase
LGIPLPIWRTEDKQEEILVGSVEELYNEIESHRCGVKKKILSKVLKLGTWMTATIFN